MPIEAVHPVALPRDESDLPAVRMSMSTHHAAALADHLLDVRGTARGDALCEQLWLRSVLVEQRRRTVMAERESFDTTADRLLAALDPPWRFDRPYVPNRQRS